MDIADLPALNASLNALASVFLVVGYNLIRSGRRDARIALHPGADEGHLGDAVVDRDRGRADLPADPLHHGPQP